MKHGFNLFMLEVAALFGNYRSSLGIRLSRKEDLLMSFLELLPAYFKTQRSAKFYADKIFVTSKHLSKAIKEITGKTLGQFINEMVVAEARILLESPSLTIGEIARQLNFSSQFSFSKFFKKHTGKSPAKFRVCGY